MHKNPPQTIMNQPSVPYPAEHNNGLNVDEPPMNFDELVADPVTYEEAKRIVEEHETRLAREAEGPTTKYCRQLILEDHRERLHDAKSVLQAAIRKMIVISHGISVARGWHDKPREDGTRIALMHSELSEMLEGVRKDTMDDHIPTRKTEEVEAADLLIRLLDHCGLKELDLWGAYFDKTMYNCVRADHDPANRAKAGGKKF